jgi:hypothetical protein
MRIGEYESVLLDDEAGPVGRGDRLAREEVAYTGILSAPKPKQHYWNF